jgi:hypothetical protein
MAKIVTVDGQKYQIGAAGGIRKLGADGKPTGGAVTNPRLRSIIRKKYIDSGSEVPKTKSGILSNLQKAFSLDNDILQYMMKNTPGDALKQVITSNKADQKNLITKPMGLHRDVGLRMQTHV